MRLYEALHNLTERFAPMSEKSSVDLGKQSQEEYMKILDEVEDIDKINTSNANIEAAMNSAAITDAEKTQLLEKLQIAPKEKLSHKVVRIADKWWARYLISALFVWIQPVIQNYLNPPPPEEHPQDFRD